MVRKLVVSVTIVIGVAVGVAAPAMADDNPFAGQTCTGDNCQPITVRLPGGDDITQMQAALDAAVGLEQSSHPGQ